MANICIIPARGESKRLPKKNIKLFSGKPVIAYSIEAAINSGLFDEVMVSTDDAEISEIAIRFGAKIPFLRSNKTSDDYATTFDVIEEVISQYDSLHLNFDFICCIYPCSPLIAITKLKLAFQLLKNNNFDVVLPIVSFSFPVQRAVKIMSGNKVSPFYPEFNLKRSQDLEKSYHDAGQFYWMNTKKILENKKLLVDNTGYIILSEMECQDIDNELDWELTELKYQLLKGKID